MHDLCLMYSKLREGEIDSFFVEGSIYRLVHVEEYIPIIGALHPYSDFDVYAAGCQFSQLNEGGRSSLYALVCFNDIAQYCFHFLKVFSIVYSEVPFNAAGI